MLTVDHLRKSFGSEDVLSDISIRVARGEIVAIVGPSGAGKTTLLNIIAGLITADGGHAEINRDSRLGYMLQEAALLPWRTIAENAGLGLEVVGKSTIAPGIVQQFMREFELSAALNKYPHQCSIGMQQRAALIRTLSIEPDLLLLDEPFSSLDYDIKLRTQMRLIDYVENRNAAVLFVTHDIEDAIALSDKVIVLSSSPTKVKAEVPIERGVNQRDPVAARTSPKFGDYFERIWKQLQYLPPSC